MRIQFPIQYEIRGVKVGNRSVARYAYRETVAVDIRETSKEHAPVAVEWQPAAEKSPHRHANSDCNVSGPDGLQLTRWYDGHHWKRLCEGHFSHGGHFGALVGVRRLEELLSDPSRRGEATGALGMRRFEGVTLPRPTRWIETDGDPTDQFKSISLDGRADAIRQLTKAFGDLIEVDGVVHQRSFEPYLSVVIGRMGMFPVKEIGIEAKEQTRWNVGNKSHAMFAADDWERAIEFALGDETLSPALNAAFDRVRPRILLTESISYDWSLSYQVASKMTGIIKHMAVMLIPTDPRLVAVVESMDADEQHNILTSIDKATVNTWKARGVFTTPYWEALEILEERPISIGIPNATLLRP